MPDIGVVLKVPEDTHTKLKRACSKHDRSMQKVLLALIEGWVANGSPDPLTYGKEIEQQEGCDRIAREGLRTLARELQAVATKVEALEEENARRRDSKSGLAEMARLLAEETDRAD